ncbi:hypothetical protein [Kitasatospora sp. NPDC001683]
MRLGEFLTRAGKAATSVHRSPSQRALDDMRREHNKWADTVKPGIRYYAALPIRANIHASFVFDRRSSFGPLAGQWLAAGSNSPSWSLWRECGPFILEPRFTQADQNLLEAKIEADFLGYAANEALARFEASPEYAARMRRLEHEYPATVAALAA